MRNSAFTVLSFASADARALEPVANGTAAASRSRSSSGKISSSCCSRRRPGRPSARSAQRGTPALELLQLVLDGGQIHPLYGGRAMRLAKYLASAGVASRRAAEELIRSGRGVGRRRGGHRSRPRHRPRRLRQGRTAKPRGGSASERVVFAVNKPLGVVSTARTPRAVPRSSRSRRRHCACTRSADSTSTPRG